MVCYACAALRVALCRCCLYRSKSELRSTVRVVRESLRQLCSAWLCWQLAWADLGAGRVPREIFRAHSGLPRRPRCASMTSWRELTLTSEQRLTAVYVYGSHAVSFF
jgi:hypothetical protein